MDTGGDLKTTQRRYRGGDLRTTNRQHGGDLRTINRQHGGIRSSQDSSGLGRITSGN